MAQFTKRIDSGIRDVGYSDNSPMESSAYNVGNPGAVLRHNAYRFTGVNVPKDATITSAKITFVAIQTDASISIVAKIEGVAEDNTAEFVISPEDTARTRAKTSSVAWSTTVSETDGSPFDTPDIASIIQEIVNRAGWSSGNAMAFWISDNGSASGEYLNMEEYTGNSADAALLTINYVGSSASASVSASKSPSPSVSPSSSTSASPGSSASITPSISVSASPSGSISASPSSSTSASPSFSLSASKSLSPSSSTSYSPSPLAPFLGLKIAKPGINVLLTDRPYDFIFSSDYGTLKYFTKQTKNLEIDASAGDISVHDEYVHNLGYYPYCEVYVKVWIDDPSFYNYEYCPFAGSGATVEYSANVKVTTTGIHVYGYINGMSSELWHFDFLIFVFKNNLQLS